MPNTIRFLKGYVFNFDLKTVTFLLDRISRESLFQRNAQIGKRRDRLRRFVLKQGQGTTQNCQLFSLILFTKTRYSEGTNFRLFLVLFLLINLYFI